MRSTSPGLRPTSLGEGVGRNQSIDGHALTFVLRFFLGPVCLDDNIPCHYRIIAPSPPPTGLSAATTGAVSHSRTAQDSPTYQAVRCILDMLCFIRILHFHMISVTIPVIIFCLPLYQMEEIPPTPFGHFFKTI